MEDKEKEDDYNFLERAKAFGEAVMKQPTLHPAQIAPSFFNEYKSFGDLKEAYKNQTIGKEYIDNEINKITAAWDLLPDWGKQGVMTGLQGVGAAYQDLRTVEGWEKFDPRAWILATGLRGLEGVGAFTDKFIGQPVAGFAHNQLGIDKRGADALGFAADVVLGDKALSKLGKLKHLSKLNRLNKGKKFNPAKIIDEVNSYSTTTLNHSKRLIQFDPEINLDPFLFDEVRDAEKALKAGGKTPSTENIFNYLNEYKTDHTIVPKKDWYNPNFPKTTEKELFLYAKDPADFKKFNTLEEAHAEATADFLITKAGGKKWSGLEAEIGNPIYGEPTEFVKLYVKGASKDVKVLPYNKWFQQTKDPFRVPKDVANKLKKMEEGRQIELIDDVPPTYIEKVKKGKSIRKKAEIKLPQGTVDKWIKYVKDEIGWQTAQQRVDEKFAKELYKKHGIPYTRGKTVFSRDKSHAVPRSEGGPGYTFLEAWWSNQQRGRKPILSEDLLKDLGVPKTWEEYFWRWYQQEELGEAVSDFGKLDNIKWDDYERAMNGVSIDEIRNDRKTINHLIQRQIEDPTTFNKPGDIGATIGEDFELLVKKTKSLPADDELLGEINPNEFDLRWRAANFELDKKAKPNWIKARDRQKYDDRRNRWVKKKTEDAKKESKKLRTRARKQGQGDFDKEIQNLQLEEGIKKEIGVELISEKEFLDILNKGEYKDFLNTIFPDRF